MKLINNIVALSLGTALVSAEIYHEYAYRGPQARQHMFNESNLNDLHNPNSTNSVKFNIGGEEWTWRVNLTSLSVPDARLDLDSANGPPLPDPRVITTTFDLTWPNASETLNETAIRFNKRPSVSNLQSTSRNSSQLSPICMSVLATPTYANVTNALEDNSSGDCTAALGEDCVRALLSQSSYDRRGACAFPDLGIDACQGAFSTSGQMRVATPISQGAYQDRANFTTYYSDYNDPKLNISYLTQTHIGESVFFANSAASPEPNSTALEQAESQFRFMLLTLPDNSKAAVCTRVNTTIDDGDVSDVESAAVGLGAGAGGALGSVGIVGLAIAMFGLL